MLFTVGRQRTGSVRQIGDNKFAIRIRKGKGIGENGFYETFEGTGEEAEARLKAILDRLAELERHPERAKTVSELVGEYLTRRAKLTVSAKTLLFYEAYLYRYIAPNIGEIPILDLKASRVRKFYDDLKLGEFIQGYRDDGALKTRPAPKPVSANTIKKVHTLLTPAFAYASEMDYLESNPMTAVRSPKQESVKTQVIEPGAAHFSFGGHLILSRKEFRLFDKFYRHNEERTLFYCAYFTGARPEEYLAMRWQDIDLENKVWHITQVSVEMPGGKENWRFEPPKTKKSKRSVPLVPELVELLRELRRVQIKRRLRLGALWKNRDLVFCTFDGDVRQETNVNRQFKSLLERAGLPKKHKLYNLRHAFATHLLDAGANLKDVSELLGHSSIRVTADVYAQVSEERKTATVERLRKKA